MMPRKIVSRNPNVQYHGTRVPGWTGINIRIDSVLQYRIDIDSTLYSSIRNRKPKFPNKFSQAGRGDPACRHGDLAKWRNYFFLAEGCDAASLLYGWLAVQLYSYS